MIPVSSHFIFWFFLAIKWINESKKGSDCLKKFYLYLCCIQLITPTIVQASEIFNELTESEQTLVEKQEEEANAIEINTDDSETIETESSIPEETIQSEENDSLETIENSSSIKEEKIEESTDPIIEEKNEYIEESTDAIEETIEIIEEDTNETPTEETNEIEKIPEEEQTSSTSEIADLPDDTVITMSEALLKGIKDDVTLIDTDKITIGELKKVTRIIHPGALFGNIDSLEGLQYAENLYYLSFGTTNDNDYDIDDLSPLSNLENLRRLDLPNSKVTDFRPLKKMAENIINDVPVNSTPIIATPAIQISTRIDTRQMKNQSFDPFNELEAIKVNEDGETWDFDMPFYAYDGSRLETDGGDVNYIGSDRTARIGSNIDNVFQIKLKQEVTDLPNANGIGLASLTFSVSYISELRKPNSPFLQKIALRGILREIDRETLEEKTTDFGILKDVYGYVGETLNTRNEYFEESKPVHEIFTGTFQRKASEEVIHYVDQAIDNGLSYVQLNYKNIRDQTLRPSVLHIRVANTDFTLPTVPVISGYGLISEPPEKVRVLAEGETLVVDYIYGQKIEITDPVLEQQIRRTLGIDDTLQITDYAMSSLETLEYDAGEDGERIKDIRSLQYATNLTKLVLINQEIGSTLTGTLVQSLNKLTHLDLSKNHNTLYLSSTFLFVNLTYLDISETNYTIYGSEIPEKLEVLKMRKMKNTSFNILVPSRLKKLKRIDLSLNSTNITNDFLPNLVPFAKNNPLEYVDLSGNQLTDLSALSDIEDLRYIPAGSTPDFMNDRGWNFADQIFSTSQRIKASEEISIENIVKNKNSEAYLPKTSEVDFRIENNQIIWHIEFNEDGSLKNEKVVFQYKNYEDTNYSAEFTVELVAHLLKVEIPIEMKFGNHASAEKINSTEYQIKNHSEFPIEVTIEKLEETKENPLPLVEEVIKGIEGISLKAKMADKELNLASQNNHLGQLATGSVFQFTLTGNYFAEVLEEKQFAYSFQFTFRESGDSIEETTG